MDGNISSKQFPFSTSDVILLASRFYFREEKKQQKRKSRPTKNFFTRASPLLCPKFGLRCENFSFWKEIQAHCASGIQIKSWKSFFFSAEFVKKTWNRREKKFALKTFSPFNWRLQTGWSSTCKQKIALNDEEQQAIVSVIKRNEQLEMAERQRVGKLVERVERIKQRASYYGPKNCR